MKKRIYNLIILDESGSMESIKHAAVNSINESLQSIRHAQRKYEEQEHYVTFVTFNDEMKTLFECAPIALVNDISMRDYNPDCCTALYDAMGISINRLHKKVTPDDNVLVTVITDGYENSSREYRQRDIKSLVERLKSEGWVFAYIGANQDVLQVGESLAIRNTLSFEATSRGTEEMSRRMSSSRERLFSCMACEEYSADAANESFFDEDDFEEKSKK